MRKNPTGDVLCNKGTTLVGPKCGKIGVGLQPLLISPDHKCLERKLDTIEIRLKSLGKREISSALGINKLKAES